MNETIALAIKLYSHPDKVQWVCQPEAKLPNNITQLLRLCASKKHLDQFIADKPINPEIFISVLRNFIEKVLLNTKNSREKQLGLTNCANLETRKQHYQLLIRIFHPDKNSSASAAENTSRINQNYKALMEQDKQKQKQIDTTIHHHQKSRLKKVHRATKGAEKHLFQIKSILVGFIALAFASIVAAGVHLSQSDKPLLFIKQQNSTISAHTNNNIILEIAPSENSTLAIIPKNQLEKLLQNIELDYKNGDMINMSDNKRQVGGKMDNDLNTLIQITNHRKMLLFNFSWIKTSGLYEGKGKFLMRHLLMGQDQWLTREGKTTITVESNNQNTLSIKNFTFENSKI